MKRIATLVLSIILPMLYISCNSSTNCDIKITSPSLSNKYVYLARYQMSKNITIDSIQLNQYGNGSFTYNNKIQEGVYMLYLADGNYVDMLIGSEQNISVQLDTIAMPYNVRFSGSKETEDFYNYTINYFESQRQINNIIANSNSTNTSSSVERVTKINNRIQVLSKGLAELYNNQMLGVFLKGFEIPTPPTFIPPANCSDIDSARNAHYYAFYRDHFFDNVDFSDSRYFYTPYIEKHLDTYFNQILVQQYDSIIPQAMQIAKASANNDSTLKYTCNYLLSYALKHKINSIPKRGDIVGIENIITLLADEYFLNGKASWADPDLIKTLKYEADNNRNCLIGDIAKDIKLSEINKPYKSLYEYAGNEITILVFYEPDCSHCQTALPIISKFYSRYNNDDRVSVIAVCMTDKTEKINEFISKYGTGNLINVWDPDRISGYWEIYDTTQSPMIYILDKNKIIQAKNIEPEFLFNLYDIIN